MRIPVGQGYRVYYFRAGTTIYYLLTGGGKSSQKNDIARARKMAAELKGQNHDDDLRAFRCVKAS